MMNLQYTLDFLSDLAKHNNKEWMDDNKQRYHQAKENTIEFVAKVLEKASSFDMNLMGSDPKKSLFRINRDIRFSKNKDPYKTNFGAMLADGGRNSGKPGYYIHIMPSNSFVGGGLYQPSAETLRKVRQEIDYHGKDIRIIIDSKKFSTMYPVPYDEGKLKTAPKGYPKDHENIALLQLKHYVYTRKVSDGEITSGSFIDFVVESFKILYPFNQFLLRAIGTIV